ncbi:Xaa-Pro aminopeptidase [Neptunomonas phycophila]|jgi:Xaa-Pro aminopeptidase|uniref:Xaa-Pro aminopeptidase n=1 Tax=Neptunomonas TaxID=75687 RepID=UPI001BE53398|nr:Xaa-Pro aminopeptidase [Neptunomonas phycophila]MBT3145703.1 Xaa-Pro aminopeptidase [Neptunomonas phycophila]MDO6469330.1 Xaa-Pro aminopeptidase [Neptunomonas phycophila]
MMDYPRIEQAEFAARRERLAEQMDDSSAAIVPAASLQPRNNDVEFPFRQDSDFYYLTGFDEPDAVMLLIKRAGVVTYHLYCLPRDPHMEIWHGFRHGPEGAKAIFGADESGSVEALDDKVPTLLDGIAQLYFCMGSHLATQERVEAWLTVMRQQVRQGVQAPTQLTDLAPCLHDMRLIKSEAEAAVMRAAGEISAQAHIRAMQACKPGMKEYQLEAVITHHFMNEGCRLPAYSSIVGGGENACVLHYVSNRDTLRSGDLVLIDAGCEHDYYAGDITRTFPVNGQFSDEQKALYELTLKAQYACLDMIKPGVPWEAIHDCSVRVITAGLIELGLLSGQLDALIEEGAHREFYMHKLGHWLGMDVHDVGNYKVDGQWRTLQPGMVMTVEPGIYVSPSNMSVDARWRGIGIRIEDDVLITETGHEVLTASVPKTVDEIEALMAAV